MQKMLNCTCADTWGDYAPLVLRVVVGLVFAYHGYDKLTRMGVDGTTQFLDSLGIPLAGLFAVLLIIVELIGGIMMIFGLFTHWMAKLFIIVAIVAFITVHASKGFSMSNGGYEYILTLFAASFSLMITGAGKYSLDAKMQAKSNDPMSAM